MSATEQLHNLCGRKNSEIIQILQSRSHDIEMWMWFQSFTEIQNGRHGLIIFFLWAQKFKYWSQK